MNRRLAQAAGRPVITKKSFVRKQSELRKRLEHSFGAMRKGSDPPVDTADPAFVEHMRKIQERRERDFQMGPMRTMASDLATRARAARDPKDLERPGGGSRAVKPWRGHAGRTARSKGKVTKRQQAIELRGKGHTEVEIGKMIDRDPRTVRRYLNGR